VKRFKNYIAEDLRKWFGKGGEGGAGGGGWDRYNSKGERVGKCGGADDGTAYAACLSKEKAQKLGKEGIASFVRRKRAAQKKAGDAKKGGEQKKGQAPTLVKTKANEDWSDKYKDSIDCNNPKGFSQKAHCDGKKKRMEEDCGCGDHVIMEAEYQGKKVKLNDPIRTSEVPTKKFKVYVQDGDKVKVVRFGDPNMEIKRDDPKRIKNFRARHNCDNPGPKTKARYWSCYQWRRGAKVDN